ncbi:MAG: hypothetical protein HQM16_00710 [Deltaproteobacteria bacterium]|nr:hypothetical protein [Deltaproteobacteria bacterium]
MKILSVKINNRKKCLIIKTASGELCLSYARLEERPTSILNAFVDKELGCRAVTYLYGAQKEGSVHVDAFLEYNQDPEHTKRLMLYKITLLAQKAIKLSHLTKREVARNMGTSPAQLYRLLDASNYSKTIDQMFKLMSCLGYKLDVVCEQKNKSGSSLSP